MMWSLFPRGDFHLLILSHVIVFIVYLRYDFFLISQSVRQGTVNPTSYNVIMDESSFTPDQLQRLSYKLTHLYYNWPGTVRVPAPCQYAHKLAFLTGTSLHAEPSEHLSDLLYFL